MLNNKNFKVTEIKSVSVFNCDGSFVSNVDNPGIEHVLVKYPEQKGCLGKMFTTRFGGFGGFITYEV